MIQFIKFEKEVFRDFRSIEGKRKMNGCCLKIKTFISCEGANQTFLFRDITHFLSSLTTC